MPRWQKLQRHDALIHRYKEAARNAMAYACPKLTRSRTSDDRPPAAMEPLEERLLLSGTLSGSIWADLDGDGTRDAGDPDYESASYTAFLDADGDGSLDAGETTAPTDQYGDYSFGVLADGNYDVVIKTPNNWLPTTPSTSVTINGSDATGIDFGVTPTFVYSISHPTPEPVEGVVNNFLFGASFN